MSLMTTEELNNNEGDRLEAIEKLRELYQTLQAEIEAEKNDDGTGRDQRKFSSDGEWLDCFIEAVGKLLEFESRP